MPLTKTQEAVLAVLTELENAGIRAVTTTTLAKFLYLLDYYQAKETQGQTLTNTQWRFMHFGPYAASVPADFGALRDLGFVNETAGENVQQDYYLFSLAEGAERRTFEAVGLIKRAAANLRPQLREFASNLPRLLNFVYFQTEPMEEARPEEVLDFGLCRRDHFSETKPIQLRRLSNDAIQAYRARLAERRTARAKRPSLQWEGPFDEVYAQGMAYLDDQLENASGKGGTLAL